MISRISFLLVIITLLPISASADEFTGPSGDYRAWLGAGVMVVNTGVAVANGVTLAAGTSSRANGLFGVVLGSTTVAVSAFGLATADDDQSQTFSLVLGATGLASALTGVLSIKFAGPRGEKVSIQPLMNPFGSVDTAKAGLQLKVRF